MNLVEEYFLRNQIVKPVVKYNSTTYLLIENNKANNVHQRFRLFNIGIINREGDPGKFEFKIYCPSHDGGIKTRGIFVCESFNEIEDRCWWENYEQNLEQYCRSIKEKGYKPVVDTNNILLACWNILLYSYDSSISQMPFRYQDVIHQVFDENSSIEERIANLNKSIDLLKTSMFSLESSKLVLHGWKLLQDYIEVNQYGFWVAKIIGD